MTAELDRHYMARALSLARRGLYTTTPNPRVGCVLVRAGHVVGEGWHEKAGQAHAEVMALAQAGAEARGATAYVTLEPCSHAGRTPPCAPALVQAGVARAVVAMEDPNPQVQGRGLACLRAAGLAVEVGMLAHEAHHLNRGFVQRMTCQRPWVRLKTAASVDGLSALADGRSQWISGAAARADGHHWRAQACAVLTGIGTVGMDNPRLDVRAVVTPRQPLKIVLDSHLRLAVDAQVLQGAPTWVICVAGEAARAEALRARGARVDIAPSVAGRIDLVWLMHMLAERGLNEVHVEAGSVLGGALVQAGLVDEWLLYLAPALLGSGQPMLTLPAVHDLAQAWRWHWTDVTRVGEDLRVLAQPVPVQR